MSSVPPARVRQLNQHPIRADRDFVLYWMTSARRLRSNFALQHAVDRAVELGKPLMILEALRCDYPGANDRLHQFILDGMAANRRAARRTRALHYAYVEPSARHGATLLPALATLACVIVTDWYPAFFLPRMTEAAARKVDAAMEAVDANGLIPLAAHGRAFSAARFYRAFVQKTLTDHLQPFPEQAPLTRLSRTPRMTSAPSAIAQRWPQARDRLLTGGAPALAALPIDHSIPPAALRGGHDAGARTLRTFITTKLALYGREHNHPDADATSHLSPYLHFGHISAHETFAAVMTQERWTTRRLSAKRGGAREGWWGVSASAEQFLDQLVVWRELSFNGCEYIPRFSQVASLPDWAQKTMRKHARDRRPAHYSLAQLERAETSDDVWNAAQRQLVRDGWFHGYLRMLWGKKIFEWSKDGKEALSRMQSLMDRYSLDGRDPNSYAGYAWVLGRYDRPWPERPIFGTLRYMTSASAKRKLKMKGYLQRYARSG
jgi:deoxyribodipyrimidine photo-lyase